MASERVGGGRCDRADRPVPRRTPGAITVDYDFEFASRAFGVRAYRQRIQLEFIRPEKPIESPFLGSFTGRLRNKCLNVARFFSAQDAREKLEHWRDDDNHHRPHSALQARTPADVAAEWTRSPELHRSGVPTPDSRNVVAVLT